MSKKKLHTYCILEGHLQKDIDKLKVDFHFCIPYMTSERSFSHFGIPYMVLERSFSHFIFHRAPESTITSAGYVAEVPQKNESALVDTKKMSVDLSKVM